MNYLASSDHSTYFEMLLADNGPSRIAAPCYPLPIQESGHMGGTYFEHRYFVDNKERQQIRQLLMKGSGRWL
jgi:hypothetical protein